MPTLIPAPTTASPAAVVDITTPATAAAAEMEFVNDGRTRMVIKTGGTPTTLGVVTQAVVADGSPSGAPVADRSYSLLANKTYLLPRLDMGVYNDSASKVQLTFSAITDILVALNRD